MLVIATPGNAITYSAGYYSTRDLLKAGFFANVVCILGEMGWRFKKAKVK